MTKLLLVALIASSTVAAQTAPIRVYVGDHSEKSEASMSPNSVTPLGYVMPVTVDSAALIRKRLTKKCPGVQVVPDSTAAAYVLEPGRKHDDLLAKDGSLVLRTKNANEYLAATEVCEFFGAKR